VVLVVLRHSNETTNPYLSTFNSRVSKHLLNRSIRRCVLIKFLLTLVFLLVILKVSLCFNTVPVLTYLPRVKFVLADKMNY